jgi:F-type H+-transporting ATPase subunit gamma
MISQTKLRKAKKEAEENNPYFEALEELFDGIVNSCDHLNHRFTDTRDEKKGRERSHAVIVVTADKGLAGAYNHNVIKLTEETFFKGDENIILYVVGEEGRQHFAHKKIHIEGQFKYTAQNPSLHRARIISDKMIDDFLSGRVDDVSIVYTGMKDQLTSQARVRHLLPFATAEAKKDPDSQSSYDNDLNFEPSPAQVMDIIVPDILTGYIYSALVDSYCSEQNDRMMAMDNADRNADEMVRSLSIQYNRERQAMITREITEVASGAKAQRKAKEARKEKDK